MNVSFKTLTPLWTGGADKNSQIIHETGIIGSLRWWYEGIIRGMGGYACKGVEHKDNNEKPCRHDPHEGKDKALQAICPACKLFGCTGWRRQFKIEISGLEEIPLFFWAGRGVYSMAGNWLWRMFGGTDTHGTKQGKGSQVRFTFGVKALWGEKAVLKITPLGLKEKDIERKLSYLLSKIENLGAKPQNGFGQVEFLDLSRDSIDEGKILVLKDAEMSKSLNKTNPPGFFSTDPEHFFTQHYELDARLIGEYLNNGRVIGVDSDFQRYRQKFIPCSFNIRYKSSAKNPFTGLGRNIGLRPFLKDQFSKEIVNVLMGNGDPKTEGERSGGRLGVSHLYRKDNTEKYSLKIWGHVPPDAGVERARVEKEIESFLTKLHIPKFKTAVPTNGV